MLMKSRLLIEPNWTRATVGDWELVMTSCLNVDSYQIGKLVNKISWDGGKMF